MKPSKAQSERTNLLPSSAKAGLILLASALTVVAPAIADEPPAEAPAAETLPPVTDAAPPASGAAVEKIVVTATRRAIPLQNTPVAVTAVSGKVLEAAEVENIEDLGAVVPSLIVTNSGTPSSYTARIRGVGTQGDNPGLESAVGTFVDGVYRNRAGVAYTDLGELDRVEVLRGPQGTLFGRNTSAGIINILTKKPTFNEEAFLEATAGSFENMTAKGGVNYALIDDVLATRLFAVRSEREGYIDVNPGRPDAYDGNATSYISGKAQLLWQPTANADVRLIADYTERDDQCCSAVTVNPGGLGRAPGAITDTTGPGIINLIEGPLRGKATSNQVDSQIAYGNRSTDSDVEDKGISAELNWSMDRAKLTSITSFRDWKTSFGQDADFSGADMLYFPGDGTNFNAFETFTHETRMTGETGWADWLFGVFYSNEDLTRNYRARFGSELETFLSLHRVGDSALQMRGTLNALVGHNLATPVFTADAGGDDHYEQNAESIALFTHNVIHLTGDLDLVAGLRWTTETKTFDATYRTSGQGGCASLETALGLDPIAAAPLAAKNLAAITCLPYARTALDVLTATAAHHQERTEDEFSGILTLAWEVNSNANAYATYSRGHKAGGFNLDRAFSDANGSIVSAGNVVRAPDTSFESELVDAFELGLKLSNDDGRLTLNTAVFYQDFENFQLNTFTGTSFIVTLVPEVISQGVEVEAAWAPTDALKTNLSAVYNDAHYGDDLGAAFLASNPGLYLLPGETITHAPKWTLTGGVDYETRFLETFLARLHVDARWQSEMNTGSNLDPRKEQDAFATVGAKLGFYTDDEQVGLEFFARNLFDEHYINTAFDSPLQGSAVCPPPASATCPIPTGTSTIDAFVGEPRMIGATLRFKHN